ncbi:cytochrome P450 1A2-like [Mercenaria mercenaria]|uniref:cytochrome P450 1A2-like n=1 Tax=Mercenaria mercenaria TaxID=6596 RepID=UPI00234EF066|nr:cytochrome P450 1A2-like [Mercenaria mercenaria]
MPSTFLCLLHHSEYQDKMFEELDAVAGRDMDLCINDKAKCPTYEAVELETHRYIPVAPLVGPRLCGVNLEFEGYDLPKGSMVFANFWHIFHNEKIWGDPWNFRPERWLDEQGNLLPRDHVYRKNWLPFGYGRRQCIGEQFGRFRIFMYLASLLRRWKFVAPPGKMMSCDPRDQSSFCYEVTMRPKPFYCHVQERY